MLDAAGIDPPRHTKRIVASNPLGGAFYENRGQVVDTKHGPMPDIRYYAIFNGARVYFTAQGWHTVYSVMDEEQPAISEAIGKAVKHNKQHRDNPFDTDTDPAMMMRLYRMDMSFIGSNSDVEIEATYKRPHYLNYYLPQCPDGITQVPGFGGLRYRNLYDNIDLVLHASKDGLKYEFELRPGARVEDIRMRHDGTEAIDDAGDGSLRIRWPQGYTHEGAPFSYQEDRDGLEAVSTSYIVDGMELRFDVGCYDATRTLIIDPWSTYYGGNGGDGVFGIVCDAAQRVIASGSTWSDNFPVFPSWQQAYTGGDDAFLLCFDSTGLLRWATCFGGSKSEAECFLSIDSSNTIILVGSTESTDFPVHLAYQTSPGSTPESDAYLAKFDTSGIRLWSTYFGGNNLDALRRVSVDTAGNIFAVGNTRSTNLPVLNAYQSQYAGGGTSTGGGDAFVIKMSPDGNLLVCSYFGGSGDDVATGVDVDSTGGIVVCGYTRSVDFPILNARQNSFGGGNGDAFIARFNSNGAIVWSTYHGGSASDYAHGIRIGPAGDLIVSGATGSSDFPVARAFQDTSAGSNDAFLSKISSQGAILWSTYYGGTGNDYSLGSGGIAVSSSGQICLAGYTESRDFPMYNAAFPVCPDTGVSGPVREGFVLQFDSAGSRQWATWLGGSGTDIISAAAYDRSGRLYVAGTTQSENFPVYNATQTSIHRRGYADAFITRFYTDGRIPVTLSLLSAQRITGAVQLLWRTESEINAYGFIIERRDDRHASWKDIGFVAADAKESETREYAFLDSDPDLVASRISYRLRMIDYDGSFEHSPVVEVAPAHSGVIVSFDAAYPIPAYHWLTLKFVLPETLPVSLVIHDLAGREIARVHDMKLLAAGTHNVLLPVSDWQSGVYLCTLDAGAVRIVRRVMVVK